MSGDGTEDGAGGGDEDDYGLAEIVDLEETTAPTYPYQPQDPDDYDPGIALIGTGGISEQHLKAYTAAGYDVVALCNRTVEKAEDRREEFDLDADVYADYEEVLELDAVEVVDVTPHPEQRVPIVEDAIRAGKHVLSQKPFATDLDDAERLVELADEYDVKLAVNQNGRWAPHFAYLRQAVADGLIGDVHGVACNVHWDHNWIGDTPLDDVEHIVLYDFAIHWFDMVTQLVEDPPERVYANYEPSPSQTASPPLLGSAIVEFDGAQVTLAFDADTKLGPEDRTVVTGGEGTLKSEGPDLEEQEVTVFTEDGYATPELDGAWFPDGFHGAMAELLSAIEADREPTNSGRDNLATLELTFAAVASAEDGEPKTPGDVRRLPEGAG
ncbi:oxidoreductase domain-containing protein [Salinarchaeum sp. Harcht-Bsk1]|uniref:Gfo/Idh/MocA family protein n=1 Tax=Salinarchaeum sp. Harcht-Bsk1 TaxID=1333523 RepID=UPI000342400A|nr:Gfo/Idh/MocA family oxidoreductase [Salinarchaeum sp. Harcht-Bsk1]AGN01253.1 oxidoreductase domain-containing protein [Salinarchaeum sp. Harcht-Bsk1]